MLNMHSPNAPSFDTQFSRSGSVVNKHSHGMIASAQLGPEIQVRVVRHRISVNITNLCNASVKSVNVSSIVLGQARCQPPQGFRSVMVARVVIGKGFCLSVICLFSGSLPITFQ